VAAALEEKIVRPMDSFYCENGSYTVYDRTIRPAYGWVFPGPEGVFNVDCLRS
jgi:flavin-dependent dehydrogenase